MGSQSQRSRKCHGPRRRVKSVTGGQDIAVYLYCPDGATKRIRRESQFRCIGRGGCEGICNERVARLRAAEAKVGCDADECSNLKFEVRSFDHSDIGISGLAEIEGHGV